MRRGVDAVLTAVAAVMGLAIGFGCAGSSPCPGADYAGRLDRDDDSAIVSADWAFDGNAFRIEYTRLETIPSTWIVRYDVGLGLEEETGR